MRYKIAKLEDIPEGEIRQYHIGELEILVIKSEGRLFALAGRCTHAGAPLVEGELNDSVLTCPWHGSQFRITDGSVVRGPASEALKTYTLALEGNLVFVQV